MELSWHDLKQLDWCTKVSRMHNISLCIIVVLLAYHINACCLIVVWRRFSLAIDKCDVWFYGSKLLNTAWCYASDITLGSIVLCITFETGLNTFKGFWLLHLCSEIGTPLVFRYIDNTFATYSYRKWYNTNELYICETTFVFTPQPLRAPRYCRTPSGRAGSRADKPR